MVLAHNGSIETRGLPMVPFCEGLRAETLFDAIPDGISIQDKNCNIIIANRSLADVFGIPFEELNGRKCYEVYYGRENVCIHCPLIGVQQASKLVNQSRNYEVHAHPLIDDRGDVRAVLGYVRDITRQNQMQLHPNQSEKLAELGGLVSIMSHELKNPLSVIQMSIGYLSDQFDVNASASKVRKHLQIIREETERANRIIQDIVAYTKPPASHYECIDVNAQVRLALMKIPAELGEENVEVIRNIGKAPITVEMDKDHLQQVLQNLLKNACQAMPAGGRLTVSTSSTAGKDARSPGKFAEIEISDTGGGITEERIERIFKPFFTTKRDGMGLGLHICRCLVERYQGEMVVQSRKGEGATFVVRLPLKAEERGTSWHVRYC